MSEFITVALNAEGPTDYRFLKSIIYRTLEDIILNCDKDIEIYPIKEIKKSASGLTYIQNVENASKEAYDSGIKCLVLHCDADDTTQDTVMSCKLEPAINHIAKHEEHSKLCLNLIPLIPIQMSEAWMLSDIELLKQEIGATRIDNITLGLTKNAESYSDPKAIITEAIRLAQETRSRRHRKLEISELYIPFGQKVKLEKLKQLSSYRKFYDDLKKICIPYCN